MAVPPRMVRLRPAMTRWTARPASSASPAQPGPQRASGLAPTHRHTCAHDAQRHRPAAHRPPSITREHLLPGTRAWGQQTHGAATAVQPECLHPQTGNWVHGDLPGSSQSPHPLLGKVTPQRTVWVPFCCLKYASFPQATCTWGGAGETDGEKEGEKKEVEEGGGRRWGGRGRKGPPYPLCPPLTHCPCWEGSPGAGRELVWGRALGRRPQVSWTLSGTMRTSKDRPTDRPFHLAPLCL